MYRQTLPIANYCEFNFAFSHVFVLPPFQLLIFCFQSDSDLNKLWWRLINSRVLNLRHWQKIDLVAKFCKIQALPNLGLNQPAILGYCANAAVPTEGFLFIPAFAHFQFSVLSNFGNFGYSRILCHCHTNRSSVHSWFCFFLLVCSHLLILSCNLADDIFWRSYRDVMLSSSSKR